MVRTFANNPERNMLTKLAQDIAAMCDTLSRSHTCRSVHGANVTGTQMTLMILQRYVHVLPPVVNNNISTG